MEKKVFKRKIYSKMKEWKDTRNGETALLILGARRIGKSTIAEEFAKREYRSYLKVDFAKSAKGVYQLFEDISDLDYLFLQLQAIYNVHLYPGESVIIFDEIQKCPKAREAIKYLVEDGRYHYIETGSLMSIRKNKNGIMIPSEETRLSMFPLDFEEFLDAIDEANIYPMIQFAFEKTKPLGDALHRKIMRLFRLYILIGGMPQAINAYLATNNMQRVDEKKREILQLYIDDLREIDESGRASRIFESIPGELSRGKLRYTVGSVIPNASSQNLDTIWQDLENSLTINCSYRCSDPNVGLGLHRDLSYFKLYIGDTGLFVTLAFWDKEKGENTIYSKLLSDKLPTDLGAIYENVVAQSLRAAGHSLYYNTFKADAEGKSNYEIDFIIACGSKIRPIEVKSSGYKSHKSLDVFQEKYSDRICGSVVLTVKDVHKEGDVLYLPMYMVSML